MNKDLRDKIRREELSLKAYATDALNDRFPKGMVLVEAVRVLSNGDRWLTAYVNNQLAFGKGKSNHEAVENLIANHKPYSVKERVEFERTHSANLVQMLSNQKS